MKRLLSSLFVAVLPLSAVASFAADPQTTPATRDDGIRAFLANDLEAAREILTAVVEQDAPDAVALAWLAETQRRLRQPEAAQASAEAALKLDPCQAFAHNVLGELWLPTHSFVEKTEANYNRALGHFQKAAECDPETGTPWLAIWMEALRRDHRDDELRSLQRLHETGFFTPAALAFVRWMMQDLPRGAVYLTNGDMDTYPAVMLQAVEGFRTDVAVVNYHMLNTDWYPKLVSKRHGLPLPRKEPEPIHHGDGTLTLPNRQLVAFWLENEETLKRPLTLAVTLSERDFTPDCEERLQLAGGFFRYLPGTDHPAVDLATLERGILTLDPEEFTGPVTSDQDPSPIRRMGNPRLSHNILAAGLRGASQAFDEEDYDKARTLALWVEAFDATLPGPSPEGWDFSDMVERFKAGKVEEPENEDDP